MGRAILFFFSNNSLKLAVGTVGVVVAGVAAPSVITVSWSEGLKMLFITHSMSRAPLLLSR